MSKILFGQSYYLRFDAKLWQAMQPYPPLGTLYAASQLREKGFDVALFDSMLAESEKEWIQAVEQHQPEYVVIYEDNFNYLSKMCLLRMREACFQMSKMAKQRNCTVIVCGSDATDHSSKYFEHGVDFVICGEGEQTLVELVSVLMGTQDTLIEQIAGLAWPENTISRKSSPRPTMTDLDSIPFPAWDLVNISKYKSIWKQRHGYYSVNMVTTRGCPYHCNWCSKPIWGQRYNSRSPENVVEEMLYLQKNFTPDHIWFADDIMGLKPGWVQEFAELVNKNNVRIPFKSLNRPDLLLVEDTIDALKKAGCKTVWMGAESGSQKILDAMDKGTSVEQIYEVAAKLKQAGIEVAFFLQFGYPGETREDIELTLKMVKECQPNDIGISVSYPLPGTKFYERVKAQLKEKQNWQDSEDLAMLYHGPYSTDFYRQLHTVVHKEFRRKKFLTELSGFISKPGSLSKGNFRQLAALVYYNLSLPFNHRKLNRLAVEVA